MSFRPHILAPILRKRASAGGVDLTADLTDYWDADGGSGNLTNQAGGATATESGTAGGSSTGGPNNDGYRSTSAAAHFEASITPSSAVTFAMFVYVTASADYFMTFKRTSDSAYHGLFGVGGVPDIGVRLRDAPGTIVTTGTSDLPTSEWASIVYSANGSGEEIFINGVSEATSSDGGFPFGAGTFYIASNSTGGAELNERVARISRYDKVVDAEWATEYHNDGKGYLYADLPTG